MGSEILAGETVKKLRVFRSILFCATLAVSAALGLSSWKDKPYFVAGLGGNIHDTGNSHRSFVRADLAGFNIVNEWMISDQQLKRPVSVTGFVKPDRSDILILRVE